MTVYDVAIIGAGPAGCAAALALRSSGLNVVLIDRATFPRDKTCGDVLPGYTIKYINELLPHTDSTLSNLISQKKIHSSCVYIRGLKLISKKWTLTPINSPRFDFDNFLFSSVKKYSSTHIAESVRISKIKRKEDYLSLIEPPGEEAFRANIVVLATGANAELRTELIDAPISKDQYGVAVSQYFEGVNLNPDQNHFFLPRKLKDPGYFWAFPVGKDLWNVGYGAHRKGQVPVKTVFSSILKNDVFLQKRFENASAKGKIRGHKLPFPSFNWNLSGNRVLICGDSGELMDPLLGHGIDKAIKSGIRAAQIIRKSFSKGVFDQKALKEYDLLVQNHIYPELRRNHFYMKLAYPLVRLMNSF